MRIFVSNIDYKSTQDDFRTFVEQTIGPTSKIIRIMDKNTKHFKGYVFIDFVNSDDAAKALAVLGGKTFQGRPLVCHEATPDLKARLRD